MTLSDDIFKRRIAISMVDQLMSAIKIKAYTCCEETIEPNGIFCYGQQIVGDKTEIYGLHETITPTPLGFTSRREFTQEELTGYRKEFPRFYSPAEVAITDSLQKELEQWFGAEGKFPLVAINPKGKIKGFLIGWAQKLEICH